MCHLVRFLKAKSDEMYYNLYLHVIVFNIVGYVKTYKFKIKHLQTLLTIFIDQRE